ncbi:DUF4148 domain-containing protein [Paraburkholderia sp. RL17-337-BIB-A]|uniref:DUF4148 domain-containing protein n=1 Tax=Paraburkholderia sp. RL17-337-BIB-A TaxID=3031636 RepID=UPI0038BD5463
MNKLTIAAMSLSVLMLSGAFAQSQTRAEVYQELIDAQQNGLNYVTDTSYPDVNPIFAAQVARMKQEHLAKQRAIMTDSNAN